MELLKVHSGMEEVIQSKSWRSWYTTALAVIPVYSLLCRERSSLSMVPGNSPLTMVMEPAITLSHSQTSQVSLSATRFQNSTGLKIQFHVKGAKKKRKAAKPCPLLCVLCVNPFDQRQLTASHALFDT